jgi:hypothetical protein
MKSVRFRNPLAIALCLAPLLLGGGAAAGGKTHLGVPPEQILSLSAFAPRDDSDNVFRYDASGPEFFVPEGMVFVVTDVHIFPNTTGAASDGYVVTIAGGRGHIIRFWGTYERSLVAGLVIPSGAVLEARNDLSSADDVNIVVRGYLTKGKALAPNAEF